MHEKNNFNLLEMMSQFGKIKINYSGGMRNSEQVSNAFINGANKVTFGSLPVYDKEIFLSCLTTWGYKKIVLAVDIFNKSLRVNGWKYQTKINPINHIEYFHNRGLKNIKVTDISKDGTLDGPPIALYKKILKKFPNINLTTGGGIRNFKDLNKLKEIGVHNAIFGRAYYEGKISIDDIKSFIKK
jgi:phosphoribosylformimino-5-aminoimidazole carboxamide ribotide isomerase